MARAIIIEDRDSIAECLIICLRASPAVEMCERVRLTIDNPEDRDWLANGDIDTVVYSPSLRGRCRLSPDLSQAKAVFQQCLEEQVKRFVLLSSSLIYGASAHNQGLIPESRQPVCLNRSLLAEDWKTLESLVIKSFGDSGTRLTILRLAAVLAGDNSNCLNRLLRSRVAVVLPGHDPSLQFLSPQDVAAAVRCAVERNGCGIYNVAPDGVITLRAALWLVGAGRLPLPRTLQQLIHPKDHLDLIRYSWTISNKKIENELGFKPRYSSAEALAQFAANGRPEPAKGAEGLKKFDDFGMDKSYIASHGRTLFNFLVKYYWRVEHKGLNHIPKEGRAVLVGVHRGFMPWDAVMTLHLIVKQLGRYPRFLIHPGLIKFPFLFNFHTKLGGMIACQENADYVLERDELLGIYPEGIRGAFSLYRDAYRLKRFRDDYVKIALRHRAPIIPFVTVGSAEIFPILARIDWSWWKRWTEWPFFPITPTWPLAAVPLPSKWHTQFLAPINVADRYPPEAANDAATVREIANEVKERLAQSIEEMLSRRKSIWLGSIFDEEQTKYEEKITREQEAS